MSFDGEFEQQIADSDLEELQALRETLLQAYAMTTRAILEKTAAPTINAVPERWRFNRN